MEKIETRTAFIWLHDENLIWEDFKKDVEIDIQDIHDNIAASLILTRGLKHSAVLDVRGKDVSITNDAMRFGASNEATRHRIATAHLTDSLSGRLIGNFFINFFRPKIKYRRFEEPETALTWLRAFTKPTKG